MRQASFAHGILQHGFAPRRGADASRPGPRGRSGAGEAARSGALAAAAPGVPTYPLVLPVTISVMGACLMAGATAGLDALGPAWRSLRAEVLTSAAYLGCGLVGGAAGGAAGTMRGVAVATWIAALMWWWQLHLALHESGDSPAGYQRAGRHRRHTGLDPRRRDVRLRRQPRAIVATTFHLVKARVNELRSFLASPASALDDGARKGREI